MTDNCADAAIQYFGYGGRYTNLHLWQNCKELNSHSSTSETGEI